MHHSQSFMSSKLTEVHQSNVLDWIMHNLNPPVTAPTVPHNNVFYTYASKAAMFDHLMDGKIISGYYHPQYPKHVIVAYCEANKMLGLMALYADIGVDEQYDLGMYFCKFSEDVRLATSSSRQYICENVTVGAIMLPFKNANEEFQIQYSVTYSDWDVLRSIGDKGLPQISYDIFQI